jgi:hypothetical protein
MSMLTKLLPPRVFTEDQVKDRVEQAVAAAMAAERARADQEAERHVDVDGELKQLLLRQLAGALPKDIPDVVSYEVRKRGVGFFEVRDGRAWIEHFNKRRWDCRVVLLWDREES